MSMARYKKYILKENGIMKYLKTNDGDILVSTEEIDSYVPLSEIEMVCRTPVAKRYIQVFLLREDETVVKDITPWVKLNGNIEKKDTSGQSRSAALTLVNEKVNGEYLWTPVANRDGLWRYNKIKTDRFIIFNKSKMYYTDNIGILVL